MMPRLLVFVMMMVAVPLAAVAQTVAEREAAFKQAVLAYRDSTLTEPAKWLAPESPWAPFIGKQFSDGLSDAQKEEYLKAQDAMNCDRVLTLEVLGLYALHPETGPAFEHAQVREAFEDHIAPKVSFGLRRCKALKAIEDHIQSLRRVYPFSEVDSDASYLLSLIDLIDGRYLPRSKTEHTYIVARRDLLRLAICHDLPAAIRDHLKLARRLRWPIVGGFDSIFLAERARHFGMPTEEIDEFLQSTNPRRFSAQRRIENRELQLILAAGNISRARKRTFWYEHLCLPGNR